MKTGYRHDRAGRLKTALVVGLGLALSHLFAASATEKGEDLYAASATEAPDDLYATLCAACHGHGMAPVGPYPPLFGSATLATAGPAYIAIKTLQGAGNMFPLCGMATDEELTRLANDLARANGSPQPPITAADVAALRPAADECPDVEY